MKIVLKTWNPYFSYFHCTPFRPLKTIKIFFVNIFEVFYTACRRNYWTSYSTRSFLDMELRFGGHIQGKLQMFLYLSHLSPKMTPNMKLYMQHRVYLHFFGFLHRSIPTLDRANSLCYRTVNKKKSDNRPPPMSIGRYRRSLFSFSPHIQIARKWVENETIIQIICR